MLYTLTSDDEDKRVRVKVTFIDDENSHKLTSFTTGAVLQRRGIPAGKVGVSMDATTYVVSEDQRVQINITLAEAPEDEALFIPFTVTPASGTSQSDFSVSSSYTRQLRFDTKETTDQINIFAVDDRLDDEGESLTLCLGDLPEPYAVLVGLDCATINIIDNDDPNRVKVSFYSGNYYTSEDGNPAWPRVTVHPVPDREITIPLTFTRGGGLSAADQSTVTTSVTFGPDVRGGRLLTDNISYASLPIEIWALDDDEDDDGEYMDLAFGPMPDRFVSEETGYHLGGDKREGFRRPANQSRVWFQSNEFTVVPVSTPLPIVYRSPAWSGPVSWTPSWKPQRAISRTAGSPPCASGCRGTAT